MVFKTLWSKLTTPRLIDTPLGYIRWEPISAFRQWWLWLTAPKHAKVSHWSNLEQRNLRARDFTVGELLWMRQWPWAKAELIRRGMPIEGHWAESIRAAYPDTRLMHIADKMFRSYKESAHHETHPVL